jgi:hypothetical protein
MDGQYFKYVYQTLPGSVMYAATALAVVPVLSVEFSTYFRVVGADLSQMFGLRILQSETTHALWTSELTIRHR